MVAGKGFGTVHTMFDTKTQHLAWANEPARRMMCTHRRVPRRLLSSGMPAPSTRDAHLPQLWPSPKTYQHTYPLQQRRVREVPPPGAHSPRYNMEQMIEYVDANLEKARRRVAANPFFNKQYAGVMREYSTYAITRHVMPSTPSDEEEYNEEDTSSFFRLSQRTGFSKAHLCEIYKKWIAVTRRDMGANQFISWMKSIGFEDRLIISRLFIGLDEDGGGSISFTEVALGLSFIMERDIDLPQYEVQHGDRYFCNLCFKVCDINGDGTVSRFEMYKVISSILSTSAQDTKRIVEIIWICVIGEASTKELEPKAFRQALIQNRYLWRFFRKVMMLTHQTSARPSNVKHEAKRILFEELCESEEEKSEISTES